MCGARRRLVSLRTPAPLTPRPKRRCGGTRRELTPDDLKRTLQALGLWPSATLKLRGDAVPPPPPPPRPSNKPKPSDIFRKVKMARRKREAEERAAYRSAPAPA